MSVLDLGIPVLFIEGRTIPEVWQKAMIEVWKKGGRVRTEYDHEGDPDSRDCSLTLMIREPLGEPRIHRAFPGGLEDLWIYREEVVNGIHDHWVNPQSGKWAYTYHGRATRFPVSKSETLNQIDDYVVPKIAKTPHTRRAYFLIGTPSIDCYVDDPPCLRYMWFRMVPDGKGGYLWITDSHMRSWDLYKAGFMNLFAFADWSDEIRKKVISCRKKLAKKGVISQEEADKPIKMGRWAHFVDSAHIYGCYFREAKGALSVQGFLKQCKKRKPEEQVWNSTDDIVQVFFEAARAKIAAEHKERACLLPQAAAKIN